MSDTQRVVAIVEGHDGAGKTTLVNAMLELLSHTDIVHETVKFPTCQPSEGAGVEWFMNDFEETLKHDPRVHRCATADKSLIIFDRSFISTAMYQSEILCESADIIAHGLYKFLMYTWADRFQVIDVGCPTDVAVDRIKQRVKDNGGEALDEVEKIEEDWELALRIEELKDRMELCDEQFTALCSAFTNIGPIKHLAPDCGFFWSYVHGERPPLFSARLFLRSIGGLLSAEDNAKICELTDHLFPY